MDQIGCPSCGKQFQINPSYYGKSFQCQCGQMVNVPQPGAAAPPPPPPQAGYAPQPGYGQTPPSGTTALVLGLLGLLLCSILAPFAWASGARARREAQAMGLPPDGSATAGWVMGIIGTILLILGVVILFVMLAAGGMNM
jgi:hypothetical protein